jgi:CBS-domain-containing membrane protein
MKRDWLQAARERNSSFLFAPVLAGAVLLAAFALVWHRWIRRRPWPQRWL